MPHEYPAFAPAPQETPDPAVLNRLLHDVSDKLVSGLNEHDVSAEDKVTVDRLEEDCYLRVYHAKATVDPGWLTSGTGYAERAGNGPDGAASVEDSTEWQVLTDDVSGARIRCPMVTGEDILFCLALAQHANFAVAGGVGEAPSVNSARLELAICLDGSVIESSAAGVLSIPQEPAQETYRNAIAVSNDVKDFDLRHIRRQGNTNGVNGIVSATRLACAFPVSEGSHVVDLRAHRWPHSSYKLDNSENGADVKVYNRQLAVVRLKGVSKGDGALSTLTVEAYEAGDTLTDVNLIDDGAQRIADEMNDLRSRNIQRGALRNEHLPSIVVTPRAESFNPAGLFAINTVYPGFGVTGWAPIEDGAGNPLLVMPGYDTTIPGVLVVLANVQMRTLSQEPDERDNFVYGMFMIRYRDQDGFWQYPGESEVSKNNGNIYPEFPVDAGAARMSPVEDDAPLLWVVDTSVLEAAGVTEIQEIEVVASVWDHVAGSHNVTLRTQRGAISCFMLRGVTLA